MSGWPNRAITSLASSAMNSLLKRLPTVWATESIALHRQPSRPDQIARLSRRAWAIVPPNWERPQALTIPSCLLPQGAKTTRPCLKERWAPFDRDKITPGIAQRSWRVGHASPRILWKAYVVAVFSRSGLAGLTAARMLVNVHRLKMACRPTGLSFLISSPIAPGLPEHDERPALPHPDRAEPVHEYSVGGPILSRS